MFGRRSRRVNPFSGRSRSGREIVHDGQIWAYAGLVVMLAALTSPLWLFSPPAFLGTKDEFRMAGASVWAGLAVLAIFAGRSWGLSITLNPEERTVSREHRSPWSVKTLWSVSGDRVRYVSIFTNRQVTRLEAWLTDESTILIEKGVNEAELRKLGDDMARCWQVPFKA